MTQPYHASSNIILKDIIPEKLEDKNKSNIDNVEDSNKLVLSVLNVFNEYDISDVEKQLLSIVYNALIDDNTIFNCVEKISNIIDFKYTVQNKYYNCEIHRKKKGIKIIFSNKKKEYPIPYEVFSERVDMSNLYIRSYFQIDNVFDEVKNNILHYFSDANFTFSLKDFILSKGHKDIKLSFTSKVIKDFNVQATIITSNSRPWFTVNKKVSLCVSILNDNKIIMHLKKNIPYTEELENSIEKHFKIKEQNLHVLHKQKEVDDNMTLLLESL